MSNIPTQDIIDNHKTLVLLLISMKDEDSEEARRIRHTVKMGNDKFKELELIYTQMMAYKEQG